MGRRQTGFTVETREVVQSRAMLNGAPCCEVCGEYASDLQYHHRRARGMGSTRRPETNYPSNCLLACGLDHNRIESHRALAYDNGWLVKQSQSPITIPVLYRGRMVLLDDEGFTYRVAS